MNVSESKQPINIEGTNDGQVASAVFAMTVTDTTQALAVLVFAIGLAGLAILILFAKRKI